MANPITNTPQPTRLEMAAATQAGSPLMQLDPALLGHILTRMGIKDAVAYLNTCRFTMKVLFENRALWAELFNSRFPNRPIPQGLGPFEAYKDVFRYRFNLKEGIYTAYYAQTPEFRLIREISSSFYDSKIIHKGKIFQQIRPNAIHVINFDTGESITLLHLYRTVFPDDGDPYQLPENVDSFTVTDKLFITIASSDEDHPLASDQEHPIKHWDMETKECVSGYNAPNGCEHLSAIPGGRILSFHDDHTIKVLAADTLQCLQTLDAVPFLHSEVSFMHCTGDKLIFVLGGPNRTTQAIQIADLKENRWLGPLPGNPGEIKSLTIEKDRLFASCSDRYVRTWDIPTGQCVSEIHLSELGSRALAFTEGMLFMESYHPDIRIHDAEHGQLLNQIESIQHPRTTYREQVRFQSFIDQKHMLEGMQQTIEIRDYRASNSAVFRELADRLEILKVEIERPDRVPARGFEEQIAYLQDRFRRMPQREKNRVYAELFQILSEKEKESLRVMFPESPGTLSEDLLLYLEGGFNGRKEPHLRMEIRIQAIKNYLAKEGAL